MSAGSRILARHAVGVSICAWQECHCMLFLTEDNDFAGKDTTLTPEELKAGLGA